MCSIRTALGVLAVSWNGFAVMIRTGRDPNDVRCSLR